MSYDTPEMAQEAVTQLNGAKVGNKVIRVCLNNRPKRNGDGNSSRTNRGDMESSDGSMRSESRGSMDNNRGNGRGRGRGRGRDSDRPQRGGGRGRGGNFNRR